MSIVMDEQPKGTMQMLDKLPPRLAFWAGVVITAGTIFAIGFIILIVLMFKGFDFSAVGATTGTTTTSNTNAAVVANVNTTPPVNDAFAVSILQGFSNYHAASDGRL